MKKYLNAAGLISISALLTVFFISCNGGDGSVTTGVEEISGTINTDSYAIATGETVLVSGDLIIHAVNDVTIDGDLKANGAKGQSITIISDNGDITIADTGSIAAGDGADGSLNTASQTLTMADSDSAPLVIISGGKGGDGGSVSLSAPNGSITIPDIEGVIHIGNGGNGETIEVQGEDLLTTELPEELDNDGGDSGMVGLDSPTINGIDHEMRTLTEDITDPDTEEVYPAGTEILVINSEKPFSGGEGGEAGDLFWGMDEAGDSTWPTVSSINTLEHLVGPLAIEHEVKIARGRKGGNGFKKGKKGGSISVTGKHGTEASPCNDGQHVNVYGGQGGNCGRAKDKSSGKIVEYPKCVPGDGGRARGKGGRGSSGAEPGEGGCFGGSVEATGGNAGRNLVTNALGDAGLAKGAGGKGGDGGGECPDNVVVKGGFGGQGGTVQILLSVGSNPVPETTRGEGGKGGDGLTEAGEGGWDGDLINFDWSVIDRGSQRESGTTCPPCGNGEIDDPEECDGDNHNGKTCINLGFYSGELSCKADCTLDTSGCEEGGIVEFCGDGVVNDVPNEECDGSDIPGDCTDHGFSSGTLACDDSCQFDTSGCESGCVQGDDLISLNPISTTIMHGFGSSPCPTNGSPVQVCNVSSENVSLNGTSNHSSLNSPNLGSLGPDECSNFTPQFNCNQASSFSSTISVDATSEGGCTHGTDLGVSVTVF